MLRRIFALFLFFSTLTFLAYISIKDDFFKIQSVQIEVSSHSVSPSSPDIFAQTTQLLLEKKLRPLYGESIWSVDINRIKSLIANDRRVKNLFIRRELPNRLIIIVETKSSLALIMDQQGKVFYPLSLEGDLLPQVPSYLAPDGPLLRGDIFIQDLVLRQKIVAWLNTLPDEGLVSLNTISEIIWDKKSGLRLILKNSTAEVLIGFDQWNERVSQVARVIEYLDSNKIIGRVIDARYSKKVVVKLRNEP